MDSSQSDSTSVDVSASASITADISLLVFSIGPQLKFAITLGGGLSTATTIQKDKSVSRTRGFTLSDGDEYDVFDVQVCGDDIIVIVILFSQRYIVVLMITVIVDVIVEHMIILDVSPSLYCANLFRTADPVGPTLQHLYVQHHEWPQQV